MNRFLLTLITCFFLLLLCLPSARAQAPEGFTYQAALRDEAGQALADQAVSFQFTLHLGAPNGPEIYEETFSTNTNAQGLVTLEVGSGNIILGTFGDIDWSDGPYFLEVAVDRDGGNLFTSLGSSQLLSVPYALYAKESADAFSGNYADLEGKPDSLGDLPDNLGLVTEGKPAAGDLSGTYPNPTVSRIQGSEVSTMAPDTGQIFVWDGSQWAPADLDFPETLWAPKGEDIFRESGNIGIGLDTPSAKLEISSNSSLSNPQLRLFEAGNDYARLNFSNNNGNYWTIAGYLASNPRNDRLNFWNGANGDLLTLTGDGRLGLGVGISPKVGFHVGDGQRVLFGSDTLGNGDKLMWLPDLHAFRVGTVATGAASTYWNRDSIGLYSFASGLNTRAQGYGATATGRDTEATNSYAFASGFFTNADGQYSTAMGFNTDAFALGSTALGYSTDAEQNYTTALGYFSEAQAIYSVAIGNSVRAQSYASMAVGRFNLGGGNPTSWVSSDPIFEVGIGTSSSNRANALTVRKDGTLKLYGRLLLGSLEYFEDGGSSEIAARGDIRPVNDNTYDLGTPTFRWDDVFATNGTIQTSDARAKTGIEDAGYGLEEVLQLRPVNFKWRNSRDNSTHLGFLAQDLLQVIPEVVKTHDYVSDEEGNIQKVALETLGVNYSNLIPVLVKGMQEQQVIIDRQQTQINALLERVKALESQN